MEKALKIFEVANGQVREGGRVETFRLSCGVEIPAILIGEEGRGRQLGVLPVALLPESERVWKEKGGVIVRAAHIGRTTSGRPKLFQAQLDDEISNEEAIVVFRTQIGFRGSNEHTGDRDGLYCRGCGRSFGIELPEELKQAKKCPYCGNESSWSEWYVLKFKPFPGRILVRGRIAQGAAGRMGHGEQIVAIIPRGKVFRTGYFGRLYGAPPAHYYLFDGEKILAATWEERRIADLF